MVLELGKLSTFQTADYCSAGSQVLYPQIGADYRRLFVIMATSHQYTVILWEDCVVRDESGKMLHHPLNGRYTTLAGGDRDSFGYLTFGGHHLGDAQNLEDVRVFYLEFSGEPEEYIDREKWADPLRFEVLNRLVDTKRCWYLSMISGAVEEVQGALARMPGMELNQVVVESEKPYGYGVGFLSRPFFEIPNQWLSAVVPFFWSQAVPAYPIEGYNMEAGQLEILNHWNARPRDAQLFREVVDKTFISFYTFPAEHRHFVFVTNKLAYSQLADLINLDELQVRAQSVGATHSKSASHL